MNASEAYAEPDASLHLDSLGRIHVKQMADLERTRAALATALVAARERGGRDATWHRLAVRSGYAGASSVRKVVEQARIEKLNTAGRHPFAPDLPADAEVPFEHAEIIAPELNEGFVVGHCGHRVARSEWRAGLRNCERCGG